MKNRKFTVTEGDNEKTIGYNNGFRMFLPRDRELHYFRKHNGWAVDEEILVRNPDIQIFVIKTTDENNEPINYMATRDDIIEHSIEIEYHNHGSQYCLPWKYWTPYR